MLGSILNPELWAEGLTTMIVGMGIVFSFLVILVFAIHIMVKIVAVINKYCPEVVEEVKTSKKQTKSDDTEIAIAVAVAANQG